MMYHSTVSLLILGVIGAVTQSAVINPDTIFKAVQKQYLSGSLKGNAIQDGVDKVKGFVTNLISDKSDTPSDVGKWPPPFCNKLDCPKYKVIKTTKDYEIREYVATHWVTTGEQGVDYDAASYKMFMRLFNYISGKNEKKEKIAMTAPVKIRIIPGPGAACADNFTMSFFVSPSVSDPPTPSDKMVSLTMVPKLRVYVRQFSGRPELKQWLSEAVNLAKSLPKSASYHTDFYYTAGYDSPFRLLHRHNEVWFVAKGMQSQNNWL